MIKSSGLQLAWLVCFGFVGATSCLRADEAVPIRASVDGQPLAANVVRVIDTLRLIGAPLEPELEAALTKAAKQRDAKRLQELLDPRMLFVVSLNPEVRVKVGRGLARAVLQQGGFTPVLIKVLNDSTVSDPLRIVSPQSGPVYSGAALDILKRQAQTELNINENTKGATDRFLQTEMLTAPPMTKPLSGLEVEYAIGLIYSSEAGKREATIGFDVGGGNQDLGFRGETPVLFDVRPARAVPVSIHDADGSSTVASLTIRDRQDRVYPPQVKRLAPDFFFQPQIYRADGDVVLLPPGRYVIESNRGPEYRNVRQEVTVPADGNAKIDIVLKRWVNPMHFGYYCGDHHIHGAGCSHYESPTQGVTPEDMFLQVKGEGLNVGCVLTWGPCFEFQRQFFAPTATMISEPKTLLKYDLEISGFGSAALGHVCLLNLRDQTYPGSDGTKTRGWPTWTVPVLRWAKQQGGITGYPHSALTVDPSSAAAWLLSRHDRDNDQRLNRDEAQAALLPQPIHKIDEDRDGFLTAAELTAASDRCADDLPNLSLPSMNGGGAMEIVVSTPEGVCDFISAMDTARIPEWNTWYHLMNCGFPLKLSGETDFPCMSSRRVGQGRVYVHLGDIDRIDFADWCRGVAQGRSYVSDGFAHAVQFEVNGVRPGDGEVTLGKPEHIAVRAAVAFAPEIPKAVAYGQLSPPQGPRLAGDTIELHAPRTEEMVIGGERKVELVVNGMAVGSKVVPADGRIHELTFQTEIKSSSWVALRQFPQLHTNPVNVLVAGRPIRASRQSAMWCAEGVRLLWKNRSHLIAKGERNEAQQSYDRAIETYEKIARECPAGRRDRN